MIALKYVGLVLGIILWGVVVQNFLTVSEPRVWMLVYRGAFIVLLSYGLYRLMRSIKVEAPEASSTGKRTAKALSFKNPQNGYEVEIESPWAYTLLFGGFYFLRHGAVFQAIVALILSLCTAGLAWLVYPFFAKNLIRETYLRKGWVEVGGQAA